MILVNNKDFLITICEKNFRTRFELILNFIIKRRNSETGLKN